jgi:hypothetical protein
MPGRPDDPDHIDEASHVAAATGGMARPGDALSIHVADPAPWGASGFDLDVTVAAVSRAEIRDASGLFSFVIYWMPPGQEAAAVIVEGDALASSEVFVARLLQHNDLAAALQWCRGQYMADRDHAELDFDLSEHGVGTWTAYAAREGGTLRVESGQADLLPAGVTTAAGLPYSDFILYQGDRSSPDRLRLVAIGSYAYLLRGEIVTLRDISILRRTPPPAR